VLARAATVVVTVVVTAAVTAAVTELPPDNPARTALGGGPAPHGRRSGPEEGRTILNERGGLPVHDDGWVEPVGRLSARLDWTVKEEAAA
jgi:hypothetical protein